MVRSLRTWLVVWAGWTTLALFLATSASLSYRSTGRPANWTLTIGRALADWWLWALLTPLIAWLARRFAVEGRQRWRNLVTLAIAGGGLALVKTLADRAFYAWWTGVWLYLLLSTVAFNFVVFACIVTAAHGVEFYRRSRERERLEARLTEVRLQMLAMQLQPHFLFNTLNTIAELVHEDPDAADHMIVGLSELLRLSLELEGSPVTLERELLLLDRYVAIQKARFGNRLRMSVDIAADTSDVVVPALVLQPLVENAIRHAVASRMNGGQVEVRAYRNDIGFLVIEVVDDGPPQDAGWASRPGVGLANTRERLAALYGTAVSVSLGRDGLVTRARLELPARPLIP